MEYKAKTFFYYVGRDNQDTVMDKAVELTLVELLEYQWKYPSKENCCGC